MAGDNGRRRVVITGMGAFTPLGNDPETFWENIIAGKNGAGPITQFDPTGYMVIVRLRGARLRPDRLDGREERRGAWTALRRCRSPPRGWPKATAGIDVEAESERTRRSHRHRDRRAVELSELPSRAVEQGSRSLQPLLDPVDPAEHGGGLGLDGARHAGPAARHSAKRALPRTWPSETRSTRSGYDRADVMFAGGTECGIAPVGVAGFAVHARALSAQRRANEGEPAVRRRAGRLRHGRGVRNPRARGARAREEA